MAAKNAERWLSLTMLLLHAEHPLTRARIRTLLPGYHDLGEAAFQRMFERDKAALRDMGLPLQTVPGDTAEEEGYLISPAEFPLEPVHLDAREAAAVTMAARLWHDAGLASSSQLALTKLHTLGVHADDSAMAELSVPREMAETRTRHLHLVPALRDAIAERRAVSFAYGDKGTRRLDPWGMAMSAGQWYVFGADHDRDLAVRRFKLTRITGPVRVRRTGAPFDPPDPEQVQAITDQIVNRSADAEALLAIRPERLPGLRHEWTSLEGPEGPAMSHGRRVVRVSYGYRDGFIGDLAAFGTDVVVLGPEDLRADLIGHLTAMLEGSEQAGAPTADPEAGPHDGTDHHPTGGPHHADRR